MKEENIDPLQECLKIFDIPSTDSGTVKRSTGILIFMHGSPCEGCCILFFLYLHNQNNLRNLTIKKKTI